MELYKQILLNALYNEEMQITFPNLKTSPNEIVKLECYRTLKKIKAVLEDENLSDKECFMRIEKIICIYEDMGSDGGDRHDFG
ncbi:MAG: hypothetical protein IJ027_07810 [Oscillospiraceae bacterium]|nr:hypothetical protein [Oscillospiraceae bacterium]